METITITFGDQAENHVGMQKIGQKATHGYSHADLQKVETYFQEKGCITEMVHLNEGLPEINEEVKDAYLLIIRNAADYLLQELKANKEGLMQEMKELNWDKKAKMYGRVMNKNARYNVCFGPDSQNPDYRNGKGRIVAWEDVTLLGHVRERLEKILNESELTGEGNYYYDVRKCGIGYHGDSERMKVIAVRLGASLTIYYQWYHQGLPVGNRMERMINGGDLYIMSEKTTGNDWKRKSIYTLRHATGSKKFTTVKVKKKRKKK